MIIGNVYSMEKGGAAGSNHAELSRASGSDKHLRTEEWLKY